jgi:hypothetical protein
MTGESGFGIAARARTRSHGVPAATLPAPGIGTNWTHANLEFTTYDDGLLLIESTRNRSRPCRGVSRLSNPAAATRGSFVAGHTPFNRKARYTRTIHTKGRELGALRSAPLHDRITHRNLTRTPSALNGASRMRRQPIRGLW